MRAVRRVLVAALLAATAASAVLAVSLPPADARSSHGRRPSPARRRRARRPRWRLARRRAATAALMRSRARTFAGWGWAAAVVDYRAFADAPGDVVRAYDAARGASRACRSAPMASRRAASWPLMLAVRRPLACVVAPPGRSTCRAWTARPRPTGCA